MHAGLWLPMHGVVDGADGTDKIQESVSPLQIAHFPIFISYYYS